MGKALGFMLFFIGLGMVIGLLVSETTALLIAAFIISYSIRNDLVLFRIYSFIGLGMVIGLLVSETNALLIAAALCMLCGYHLFCR